MVVEICIATVFKREIDALQKQLQGPEALEAMTAFMEKRKPDFSRFK